MLVLLELFNFSIKKLFVAAECLFSTSLNPNYTHFHTWGIVRAQYSSGLLKANHVRPFQVKFALSLGLFQGKGRGVGPF